MANSWHVRDVVSIFSLNDSRLRKLAGLMLKLPLLSSLFQLVDP